MQAMWNVELVKAALSAARVSTYEEACLNSSNVLIRALELYAWNAQMSGAMLSPLHICEVVTRNAVSEALMNVYGLKWPWLKTFEMSLPNPEIGFNPRKELLRARQGRDQTDQVITEIKMMFWQKMFTARFDDRIWNSQLKKVFPYLDASQTVQKLRRQMHADLEQIRHLRNRIAHHEPIFKRHLLRDFDQISNIISHRSPDAASWMHAHQLAMHWIHLRPS